MRKIIMRGGCFEKKKMPRGGGGISIFDMHFAFIKHLEKICRVF
jgi:hypothetical protein